MTELSKYSMYDFMNSSRNPGTKVDMDFTMGQLKSTNKATEVGGETEEFHQRFYEVCKGRSFFSTRKGTFGLGPNRTKKGDLIVVLCGARTPFIMRKSQLPGKRGSVYRLIGEAYIQGIMDGEVSEETAHSKSEMLSFELV